MPLEGYQRRVLVAFTAPVKASRGDHSQCFLNGFERLRVSQHREL